MKKYDYKTVASYKEDILFNCKELGSLGWRLITSTLMQDSIFYILIFEREIIE